MTAKLRTRRTSDRAIATSNLPIRVSWTMAVVRTRVWPGDIAADHEHGPDFGNGPPESGHHGGQLGKP